MRPIGRTVLGGLLAFGLLSAVPAAVFAAQPACGGTLTSSKTLSADLDCSAYGGTALYLGAKGITLDLGGHTLWGSTGDDSYSGVDTNGYNKTTVKHGTIANFGTGVYVDDSHGTIVKNLTITGEAADNDDSGVYQAYGLDNVMTNLHISGNYYGVYLYGGGAATVSSNHITDSVYGMYSEYESGDHVSGNYAEYSYAGFYDDYGSDSVYSSNTANGDVQGGELGFYLDCDDYGSVTLKNNTTTGNSSYGFETYYCYDDAGYVGHTLVTGNTSTHNQTGFYDYYSIGATFTYNTAKHNSSDGFYMDYPGKNTFQHNIANRNGGDGVDSVDNYGTGYGNYKDYSWNTANNNAEYGHYASYGVPFGSGNVATGNGSTNCFDVRCN